MTNPRLCRKCKQLVRARGLCSAHYQQARRLGQLKPRTEDKRWSVPVAERFRIKYQRRDPDKCWPWTAALHPDGYGKFSIEHGKTVPAHQYAYEQAKGPVPIGKEVDHTCHNRDTSCPGGKTCLHRRCVNPAHLEAVTQAENLARGKSPPALNARKTHCDNGHKFTRENTRINSRGHRACRKCDAIRQAKYRLARRAAA